MFGELRPFVFFKILDIEERASLRCEFLEAAFQ